MYFVEKIPIPINVRSEGTEKIGMIFLHFILARKTFQVSHSSRVMRHDELNLFDSSKEWFYTAKLFDSTAYGCSRNLSPEKSSVTNLIKYAESVD